ncbi:hypothetical protein JCM10450v2_003461 [Rhodotorula kratochvilovae]
MQMCQHPPPQPAHPANPEAVAHASGSNNPQRLSRTPAPPPRPAPSATKVSAPAQFYNKKKKPTHTWLYKLGAGSGGRRVSGMSHAAGMPKAARASKSPSRTEQEGRAGETVPRAAAQSSSGKAQRRAAVNGVKTAKRGQDGGGGAARAKKVEHSDNGARAPHPPTTPVVASHEPVATDQPDSLSPTASAAPDTPDPPIAPPVTGNSSSPTVPAPPSLQALAPKRSRPAPAPPSTREEMLKHTAAAVAAKLLKDAARRGPMRWWHAVGRSCAYARRIRALHVFERWRDAVKKKVEEDEQHIFYKGNELRNAHTLARAGVPPGAVLRLEGLLLLRSSPSTVKVAFESSAVVDDIVTTLSRHCAPLGAYPLSLGGKTLLGGHSVALFGYGPHNVVKIAGTFLPSFPLPVTLATGGKITPIVNTFDSVQPRQLDLFIGDIKLDEKKSVTDVGLNVKSNVHVHVVQHNLVQIYVKNLAGKLIPVEVDSGRTVADVKGIIEEQEDIPRSERRLIYAGR